MGTLWVENAQQVQQHDFDDDNVDEWIGFLSNLSFSKYE